MPRQRRLDAPGASHHVMGRGIERTQIFRDDTDRADCVARLAARCRQAHRVVYAWARMPNHFHLLVRPGQSRFVRSMKKLPTGDVATVNRRHKGSGQLVQNWLARKVTAPALLS